MTLPDGFRWAPLYLGSPEGVTALFYAGVPVARLFERVDGTWFVILDYHLTGAHRQRDCSSFERGQAGIDIWATRHRQRLTREVAIIEQQRVAARLHGRDRKDQHGYAPRT